MTGLVSFELSGARRGRTAWVFAAAFAAASLTIAVVGLAAGGVITVQGFARTSVSLLQLVLWVVPLAALLLGAVAGAECHDLEFLAGLPVPRQRIVLARWAAWFITLAAALLVGLGAAGVVVGLAAGGADAPRYLALLVVALLVLAASLALGLWLGVAARSRVRAIALAVVTWFVLAVGVDLAAIAVLALLPPGPSGWGLSLLLLADPVDGARALGLGLFQADVVAGPTGAALRRVLGGWGAVVLVAGLGLWTAVPLALAGRRYAGRDL
ncbi:MAG TPA: ABC transporter permease subunit [Gemmatimonadales bacterium]|nr:ABC transporter permease subunit [Gemmatimonadales bacterium]